MDLFNPFLLEDIYGRNHDRVEDSLPERTVKS